MLLLHLYKGGLKLGFGRDSSETLAFPAQARLAITTNSVGQHSNGKIALRIWIKPGAAE